MVHHCKVKPRGYDGMEFGLPSPMKLTKGETTLKTKDVIHCISYTTAAKPLLYVTHDTITGVRLPVQVTGSREHIGSMKYAQLVIGPAGSGKSTYCRVLQEHCENSSRLCKVVNLDPAAEEFHYDCAVDIRELISVNDVMEETDYGPNGGLVFAMEYILDNMEWFEERMDGFVDDDYVLFDCPGQIELFTHVPVMRRLVDALQGWDFRVCGVYCLDISFVTDTPKFVAGMLTALSAMVQLELPHVNVLTKCDLLESEDLLNEILESDPARLMAECKTYMPQRYRRLNEVICSLLDEYSLVSFVPLNIEDEDSIILAAQVVDSTIQYGEDLGRQRTRCNNTPEISEPKAEFDMNAEAQGGS